MFKLTLALTASAAVLALPAAYGSLSKPPSKAIEQTLLQQMNSGPDGRITRLVTCSRAPKNELAFRCDLESVRSTHLGARVTVVPGGLRTVWEPLAG
jgi:hypothetical protein